MTKVEDEHVCNWMKCCLFQTDQTVSGEELTGGSNVQTTAVQQKAIDTVTSPVKQPLKTVIKIESPRNTTIVSINQPEKRRLAAMSSDTSSVTTSDTDSSPTEPKHKPSDIPTDRRQLVPSSGDELDSPRTTQSQELNVNDNEDYVEYMNTGKHRNVESCGNSSDTDSGVGGEGDRAVSTVHDKVPEHWQSKEEDTDEWDTPPDTPTQTPTDPLQSGRLELARHTELQLDLSKYLED